MNIVLLFISIFLIATLFLSPLGFILMYVAFKLGGGKAVNKYEVEPVNRYDPKPEYKMNTYDEEMLEDMR